MEIAGKRISGAVRRPSHCDTVMLGTKCLEMTAAVNWGCMNRTESNMQQSLRFLWKQNKETEAHLSSISTLFMLCRCRTARMMATRKMTMQQTLTLI